MNTEDRIKKAHIAIMQHKEFCAFSGILACGKVKVTEDIPTACTNGWDVLYNPKFIEEHMKTDPELRFLILHEAMHKAYRHITVWKSLHEQDPHLANVSADYFVNLALEDTDKGNGFVTMPKLGIQPDSKYRGWSVKQIFDDLQQQQDEDDNGQGDGEGDGFDEHDWDGGEQVDAAKESERANEIQRAIRQGEIMRKKLQGKGAGSSDGVFGDLLQPKVDWRKVLREFITETCAGNDESTWRKPNRRYLGMDIYMPSMISNKINELVIGFDTSGSCFGGYEMARFVSEVTSVISQVKPNKVHVIYWDTEVAGHQTFEDGQFAVQDLKPKGGGGTDGSVLFDYLREKAIRPNAIVQFSDGYVGDWGHTDVPTLWALTSNVRSPFGITINLED